MLEVVRVNKEVRSSSTPISTDCTNPVSVFSRSSRTWDSPVSPRLATR